MVIARFPPVTNADKHGLLAVGGDLEPASLLLAYRSGIFPWPMDEETLTWFSPPMRAVIFLESFHVSRSVARALRKAQFETRCDQKFRDVMERCAEPTNRGRQNGTWITSELIEAYCELFDRGYCHSFETYQRGELVGGIYGVQLGRFFAAESSFFRVPNASKAAMCALVDYLREEGIEWFDCQVLTPFSESFGAVELPRKAFMQLLETSF
jgi:leucyl/phenylalanyl-tRNA--protein transferase